MGENFGKIETVRRIFVLVLGMLALAFGLAWVSTGFASVQGSLVFFAAILLAAGLLFAAGCLLSSDVRPPSALSLQSPIIKLLFLAALLRLGAGAVWYTALPRWGYGNPAETAGYVMSDAFERDTAAWELAQSDCPLMDAFRARSFRAVDQYGGLLFVSAGLYRLTGGAAHQPLLMVVFAAAFSALAVLFTWGFALRLWGGRTAMLAAWVTALFPDAVLLGSSQMREAFTMTLAMMAFYGLVLVLRAGTRRGLAWIFAALLLALPLSPLFAVMLAGFLLVFAFFLVERERLRDWRLWLGLGGMLLLALGAVWLLGDRLLPGAASDPLTLLHRWMRAAAHWQAYYSERASGWMQKIFRTTPEALHPWILLVYGVMRPFLPAALFDLVSNPLWRGIAVWRSAGWALMLPFLTVAPLWAWKQKGFRSPETGVSLLVWAAILAASFRGGGDQWDNPRYRVAWIGLQAALSAWVWASARETRSPWLRRTLVSMGLILLWWVPWYLRRVTPLSWPVSDIFLTFGLGLLSAGLYLMWDLWRERRDGG